MCLGDFILVVVRESFSGFIFDDLCFFGSDFKCQFKVLLREAFVKLVRVESIKKDDIWFLCKVVFNNIFRVVGEFEYFEDSVVNRRNSFGRGSLFIFDKRVKSVSNM